MNEKPLTPKQLQAIETIKSREFRCALIGNSPGRINAKVYSTLADRGLVERVLMKLPKWKSFRWVVVLKNGS